MRPQTLSLFCVVLCLSISGSFGTGGEIIISSNGTSVEVGKSIKFTCQVENFTQGTEPYKVIFYRDGYYFCDYDISATDSSGHRNTTFVNINYSQPSLGRQSLSSTFPVYEITVTPTLSSTQDYYCNLWRVSPGLNVNSKHLSLTATLSLPPRVVFSSNGTSVEVGQTVKLRCQLENFEPGKELYRVIFNREGYGFICAYHISEPDSSGQRTIEFQNYTTALPDLGRQPLSSTFPVFEITLTPTLASTIGYYCELFQFSPRIDVNSKPLSLTATSPPPSAVLSSNVPAPLLGHPFTLTCTFDHFASPPVKYSVQFSSSRDGQLAVLEVSNGSVLLSDVIHSKVQVFPGPKSTFPTFHLVLNETVDNTSTYWCGLVEAGKAQVISKSWPILVNFSASKVTENQRVGTCAVGATGLYLNGKTYSVQFLSDLGPEAVNLLGEYIFRPNLFEEFKSNPLPPWTSLTHGPSTSWPSFSLLANGTSLHGTWWCVIVVGANGSPGYREITSNKVDL